LTIAGVGEPNSNNFAADFVVNLVVSLVNHCIDEAGEGEVDDHLEN
jgi:hypothetical protein